MLLIKYGIYTNNIDITNICMTKLNNSNIITIPAHDDNRTPFFTDPVYGVKKKIFIVLNDNINVYDDTCSISINLITYTITTDNK